jgi:hypothetical protein
MKHITIVLLTTVMVAGCGRKQPIPSGRLQQPAGRFSLVTPEGWYRTKLAGLAFVIVSTDSDFGAEPNIFVDFVKPSISFTNVVSGYITSHRDSHPDFAISQQVAFETESGLNGVKISAGRKNTDALPLATFHYLLEAGDRVIAITGTCADPAKVKYEPIFDSAMKSLRSE